MTRSVVLNWVNLVLRMGVGFALLPFILRHVGASGYGYYLLLISIFGYGQVLDMGFNAVVIRYVARHAATGEVEILNRILGVVFGFYTFLSLLILTIVSYLALHPMSWMLPKDGGYDIRLLVFLAGTNTAIMFHQLGWTSVVRARERFDLSNYIQISGLVFRTTIIIVLLLRGYGIAVILAADLAEVVFNGAVHRMVARRMFPEIRPNYLGIGRNDIKVVTDYGVWVFFNSLAQQIRNRAHNIIIGAFLPAAAITHYGVAGRLQSYFFNLANNMTSVIRARLSFLEGGEDWTAINELYLRSLRLVGSLAVMLTAVLFLESYDFFTAWLGLTYQQSGLYMRILLPAIAVNMTMTSGVVLVYAIGRHRPLTFILLGEAATLLLSTIVLIQHLGLVGVAIGVAGSMLLFKGVILPAYAARTIRLPQRRWIHEGILPVLSILPVGIVFGLLLRTHWSGGALLTVVGRSLVSCVPYALAIWWFVLRGEDRDIVLRRLKRLG